MGKNARASTKEVKKVVKKIEKVAKASKANPTRSLTPKAKGHGSYSGDAGAALASAAARAVGVPTAVAGPIGGWLGDKIGSGLEKAGNWFSKLLGFGAYRVRKNSLLRATPTMVSGRYVASGFPTNSPPIFNSTMQSSDIEVAHREFVGNIKSSMGFRATKYVVNPGNSILHPWMSKLASLYEEYDLQGMVFEYKPTSATAVGTVSSAMGAVIMASDYDPYDENFSSKRAMEAAEYSTSGAPFELQMHPIECDARRNVLRNQYVVPGISAVSEAAGDARFSVHCCTTVATEGQQVDDTIIGELWVTSHYKFSRPILEDNLSSMKVIRQKLSLPPIGISAPIVLETAVKNTSAPTWDTASGTEVTRRGRLVLPPDWKGRLIHLNMRAYSTGVDGDGFYNPSIPYVRYPEATPPTITTFPPWFADTTYGTDFMQAINGVSVGATFDYNHHTTPVQGFTLDAIIQLNDGEQASMDLPLPVTGLHTTIVGTLTISDMSMPANLPPTLEQRVAALMAQAPVPPALPAPRPAPAPAKSAGGKEDQEVVTLDDFEEAPDPAPLPRASRAPSRK